MQNHEIKVSIVQKSGVHTRKNLHVFILKFGNLFVDSQNELPGSSPILKLSLN